jgi:hypothetical protein
MKKMILSMVAFLFVVAISFAQQENSERREARFEGKKGIENRKMDRKKMIGMLHLTDAQKQQLKSIQQDYQKKIDLLDQQQNLTVKEYNDRKTALRKDMITKRQTVFTKEQKNRIETAKQLHELKMKEMRIKRMAMMREKLDLSDEQVNQINSLHEKKKAEIDKIKNDAKLNDQEKLVRIKAVMNEVKDAQKKIMTEEQLGKLENIKKSKEQKRPKEHREKE